MRKHSSLSILIALSALALWGCDDDSSKSTVSQIPCDETDRISPDCTCNKSTGKWDCSSKCTGDKPADDCTCAEDAGSWGWKCPSNCSAEQPAADCLCQDSGSWLCDCNENALLPRQTCDCNPATGEWIESTCTYSCLDAPESAKTGTCHCNNKTGELEGCQYNCQDSEKPHNAKSCECDETTGSWKTETCKYNCPDKPSKATSCDCDESTGNLINCIYTCSEEPDNVVAGTCNCDPTTGDWNDCQYIACNNSDKPTEHVKSCECVEGAWECIFNCPSAKPDGAVVDTCVCQSNGEWSCEIDKCQGKTLLVGQVCDKATGNITYNKTPELDVRISRTSISENGGTASITVKLLGAQPDSDVPLTLTVSDSSRVTITNPPDGNIIPAAKWNTGVTYKVTATNNDAIENDIGINFSFTTYGSKPFNALTSTVGMIVTDDDKPSIILDCDGNELYYPASDEDGYYNNLKDPVSIKCSVSLGKKPQSDVSVVITTDLISSETADFYNNNSYRRAYPAFGSDEIGWSIFNQTIHFKANDYSTPQVFYLHTFHTGGSPVSTAPEYYDLVARSNETGYVAEQKLRIKTHVMNRYKLFNYNDNIQRMYLPKGKYRLHAIGASGGLPASAGSNYKLMEVSCNTSTGKASFKYKNHGGAGAYIYADLNLTASETIYIYTGEAGKVCESSNGNASFNGGGRGRAGGTDRRGVSGGGATDFCIGHEDCATYDKHWPYRILVAGGGGGGSAWEYADTTYEHGTGGSAKWISFEKGYGVETGGNGLHYGAEKYGSSTGEYYAPCGYVSVGSLGSSTDPSNFGKGRDAEDDYVGGCSADDSRRNGGGGGGWYGGTIFKCARDTGGGAGSSYAFNGSNQGNHGKQDTKYKLTNVGGEDGGTSCNVFKIKNDAFIREITSGQMLGLGNGMAWIEVLE